MHFWAWKHKVRRIPAEALVNISKDGGNSYVLYPRISLAEPIA